MNSIIDFLINDDIASLFSVGVIGVVFVILMLRYRGTSLGGTVGDVFRIVLFISVLIFYYVYYMLLIGDGDRGGLFKNVPYILTIVVVNIGSLYYIVTNFGLMQKGKQKVVITTIGLLLNLSIYLFL